MSWIVCNKIDLLQETKINEISKEIEEKLQVTKEEIFFISAATGEGTEFLLKSLESEIYKNKRSYPKFLIAFESLLFVLAAAFLCITFLAAAVSIIF